MTWICEKSFSLCIMFVSIYIFSLFGLEITELCIMEFGFHNLLSCFYDFFQPQYFLSLLLSAVSCQIIIISFWLFNDILSSS